MASSHVVQTQSFYMMRKAFSTTTGLLDEHVIRCNLLDLVATVNYEGTCPLFFRQNVEKSWRERGKCVGNVRRIASSRRQESQSPVVQRGLSRASASCCSRCALRSEKRHSFLLSATLMVRRARERASSYFPCSFAKHAWSKSASASR